MNEETCIDCLIKAYNLIDKTLKEIPVQWYFIIGLFSIFPIANYTYKSMNKIRHLNISHWVNVILLYSVIVFILFMLPFEIFKNTKKEFVELLSAFGPWITAIVVIKFTLLQYNILREQKEIAKYQGFMQRTTLLYSEIIKEKQNKTIELRSKYLLFQEVCYYFLSIIFPHAIKEKVQQEFAAPNIDIENAENLITGYYSTGIMREKIFADFHKICSDLYSYLKVNEVFFSNNKELYTDLITISKAFKELFEDILCNKSRLENFEKLKQIFNITCSQLNFDYAILPEIKTIIISMRIYFYNFIHYRLIFERENSKSGILYMIPNTIFQGEDFAYTKENIEKWSENEVVAFHTYHIFIKWFETWQRNIDSCFNASFGDIISILNNGRYFCDAIMCSEQSND